MPSTVIAEANFDASVSASCCCFVEEEEEAVEVRFERSEFRVFEDFMILEDAILGLTLSDSL